MSRSTNLHELRALMRQWSGTVRSPPPSNDSQRRSAARTPWPPNETAVGKLSEWIALQEGSGAVELALSAVRERLSKESRWLIVDPLGETYGPALKQLGLDLSRVALATAREPREAVWAVEQGLRSRGVDVVCCRLSKLAPLAFRRLKLAAEAGGSRGLLMRGPEALRETCWADVRLLVSPLPSPSWRRRRFRVETLRIRNAMPGEVVQVERDDETGAVRVVSELADSADGRCAAGA